MSEPLPQKYDYILVLDFEATCLKDARIHPQEIIEFPCIMLETKTSSIKSIFHQYVRPVKNPVLSSFCTEFTGITQRMVDESKTFPDVFNDFLKWVADEIGEDSKLVVATCGDWDLNVMLPAQLRLNGIYRDKVPTYLKRWINVKKVFERETKVVISRHRNDLTQMMETLKLPLVGHLHSGIDDVKNIAKVVEALMCTTTLEITWTSY